MRLLGVTVMMAAVAFAMSNSGSQNGQHLDNASKRTAAESMRAFGARSLADVAQEDDEKRSEESVLRRIGTPELIRRLEEVGMFSRAIVDPYCTTTLSCSDNNNRLFVEGQEYPTLNGQCNNVNNWSWGVRGVQHQRILPNAYRNGRWDPRMFSVTSARRNDVDLPHPRSISNAVHKTTSDKEDNTQGVSLALFYFMQFIDHDIVKTPEGNVPSSRDCCTDNRGFCMAIIMPGDEAFTTNYCMEARRSDTKFDCTDADLQNQYNDITAYIDGSGVYGSTNEESAALRSRVSGYLKTSTAEFLPEATSTVNQACANVQDPAFCLLAGDTRADVHPGLTALHTVFTREHNRIAEYLGSIHDTWSDDRIFYTTRKIITAIIQRITLKEMLPKVLDSSILSKYGLSGDYSYNNSASATIISAFSIAYRYHNLMPATLHKATVVQSTVANSGEEEQENVWMDPGHLFQNNYHGVDRIALGQVFNGCPMSNGLMNDAARNFLFKDNDGNAFDLATVNIMRAREWGTPAYTEYRKMCGVGEATAWSDLLTTHSQASIDKLSSVYLDVRDVDLWTGVVTEEKVGSSISGPTQSCLVGMQFGNLRNGDRFWYETNDASIKFTSSQLQEIEKVTLARVLCDNLAISTMRTSAFDTNSAWTACTSIAGMDLSAWA